MWFAVGRVCKVVRVAVPGCGCLGLRLVGLPWTFLALEGIVVLRDCVF